MPLSCLYYSLSSHPVYFFVSLLIRYHRCMTPPLNEEVENEESRLLEMRAGRESKGCLPCYPPYLEKYPREVPSDNIVLAIVPRKRRPGRSSARFRQGCGETIDTGS